MGVYIQHKGVPLTRRVQHTFDSDDVNDRLAELIQMMANLKVYHHKHRINDS